MSDNKITQDQLEPNVMEELESGIGDLSTLSTENKDSLVAAVTEIYGKNIIAEAIGEPLAVTDTFSEMGSEINSLLSSFKTNMMNSGVTVESGDKFKQLIDKIKGLTEGEGNKGIQFAEGTWDAPGNITSKKWVAYNIASDIGFIPTYIFLYIPYLSTIYEDDSFSSSTAQEFRLEDFLVSNINTSSKTPATISNYSHSMRFYFSNISENGFTLNTYSRSAYSEPFTGTCKWYAIGVGEEDTTLRDSLASILQEEGVSVTEEDDMASLITKVDEEFSNKNEEIDYMIQGLTTALVNKGVKLDTDDDFESLLNTMNDMEYIPEIYYLIENGQPNNELEWGYADKGEQRNSSYYLPSSGEGQRLSLQDIVAIKTYTYLNLEINVINNSTSGYHQYLSIYDASNELVVYRYISGSTTIDREVLKIDISNITKGFSFSLTSGTDVSVEVFNCYISKE